MLAKKEEVEPFHISITEVSGAKVSEEQIQRVCNRYYWAGSYCQDKDVLEVSCGTGVGIGYLSSCSRSFQAGDYLSENLALAKKHYQNRVKIDQLDAQALPYPDNSFDVIVCLEAIYFYPSVDKALSEFKRVLRDGGKLLLSGPNKDLFDFHPSKFAFEYFGVVELREVLTKQGFLVEIFGDTPMKDVSLRQKILRPLKAIAAKSHIMPQTKRGKRLLRRLFYGQLNEMPAEIQSNLRTFIPPTPINSNFPDRKFKILFCAATLSKM